MICKAFLHCSRATLYGFRFSRTCFARGVLRSRDRFPSHSLAGMLPGPAPAAPVSTFPLASPPPSAWVHETPGSGAIPGHTHVRGCPRDNIQPRVQGSTSLIPKGSLPPAQPSLALPGAATLLPWLWSPSTRGCCLLLSLWGQSSSHSCHSSHSLLS